MLNIFITNNMLIVSNQPSGHRKIELLLNKMLK